MRRFQAAPLGRTRTTRAINAETRAMFEAYAEGVNGFIETTESLPVEYAMLGESPEAWTAQDCLAVFKARHVLMGHMEAKLWRAKMVATLGAERAAELMPQYEKGGVADRSPGGRKYFGDNYDALGEYVSGGRARGRDGGCRLRQQQLGGSRRQGRHRASRCWRATRTVPSRRRASTTRTISRATSSTRWGCRFRGVRRFRTSGTTRGVAWCVTHAAADYQDLYVESFRGRVVAALRGQRWLETRRDPQRGDSRQGR